MVSDLQRFKAHGEIVVHQVFFRGFFPERFKDFEPWITASFEHACITISQLIQMQTKDICCRTLSNALDLKG